MIVNGDQLIQSDLRKVIADFRSRDLGGGIIVFESVHPRWSYVKTDGDGMVIEAAEKRPISKLATAGFYYFQKGSDFVRAAITMLKKDAREGGAFYICPTYNELVLEQKRIGIYPIARTEYHSLKTPAGIRDYETRKA